MIQEEYLTYIAERNFNRFFLQGFATPGNNGPHGHLDTPVRNTSHYLIIYGYLYKKSKDLKYLDICYKFANYLCEEQGRSKSGAIKCMITNKFDYLNGLIGQAWVIEALLYFYDISKRDKYLTAALNIYKSQKYDYKLHLWRRTELDGTDIGIDFTYNHNVWFAATSSRLVELCNDNEIDIQIKDFINYGTIRDFKITYKGLLRHTISVKNNSFKENFKKIIKILCTPIKYINPRKLDVHYIENAYQIFDIYGFQILKIKYGDLDFFKSKKYLKAETLACNIEWYNKKNIHRSNFNVFSYSYNSPAFELPYVYSIVRNDDIELFERIFDTNKKLMYSNETQMFTINNYDVELFNARSYEIIRYLERGNEL